MKIVLCSLLEKLLQDYEKHHSRMYFMFQKNEGDYVFTDVNQTLLQTVHQQRTDFVGQTIDTAPHLGDEATRAKLKTIYPLAWSGKKVIFYCFPERNVDIFVITYLEPQYKKGKVVQVRGRCASFDKNEFHDTLQHLEEFVTFEMVPE
ncbi:hypothetical protein CBR56_28870 [Bacillus thuringiensis]|uniref:hypothetical protein n=1 Tax=Bacillus tropicus TaxID=2026188 RepID=UPI000B436388|nr:hypothetical protein [Bacillus tropicus]MED3038502.1 hypothetical protein [Bacillus tropicus]OTX89429.1 hypothetical protein BK728_04550 [Bacillus thuringiensis serovar chanpaisis]PNK22653.1 hypothetical protein CBR56_28870 [Bacillus thuringiensis]